MAGPSALLVGPRGRRLCLEFAELLTRNSAAPASDAFLLAASSAAYDLDPGRGISRVRGFAWGDGLQGPMPTSTPADVARLLDTIPLVDGDERALLAALAAAVDGARYWQEPDGEDVLAASPEVRGALARVAAVLTSSDLTTWWTTRLGSTPQWSVTFDDPASPAAPGAVSVAERLVRWRSQTAREEITAQRERPSNPRAAWSGTWWSTPPAELTRTTRCLGVFGPIGLWLVEDRFGWERATARPVAVPGDASVYEIDGPESWAWLCRRYPLEVTASRRHDWYRTTGVTARWVIPDWSHVANDIDAVHLTVAGYLTTAGRPLVVTDDAATVLAGWHPDATWWLTDIVPTSAIEQPWVRHDDGTWSEQPP